VQGENAMKKIHTIVTTTTVICLATMFSFLNNVLALTSQPESGIPYMSITPGVESTIEKTAIIAIRHISQARSDIHRKEWAGAQRELAEAERLMLGIRHDLSSAPAKNLILIARKHLEYEQAQQVLQDFPPIYSSLEKISVYLPTDKAKMHIDKAKSFLEKNNKPGAERELVRADKLLIIVEMELPLLKSQQFVKKAQGYIATKDTKKADEALQGAIKRAMALSTGMSSDLFQAKQNVWRASRNYYSVKESDARAYLEQARENLAKVAAGRNEIQKQEVGKLSQEILELEKKLSSKEAVAESVLKAAWERSEALTERLEVHLLADLSEAEATNAVENNLIEASLHVEYAETYQVTASEPAKAAKELETAYSYLQKAASSSHAGSVEHKKMRELCNIVLALKTDAAMTDINVKEHYEDIIEELNDTLQNM
jgi:hypothetical protein